MTNQKNSGRCWQFACLNLLRIEVKRLSLAMTTSFVLNPTHALVPFPPRFRCTQTSQMMKKYDLEEFQLSQSYTFFVDSLSKANYFLEQMLDLADQPLDDRLVQVLLTEPENDGGQWDMLVGLVETFGLVPQSGSQSRPTFSTALDQQLTLYRMVVYPESFNSSATGRLDTFLTSKLREYALELRALFDSAIVSLNDLSDKSRAEKKALAIQSARRRKEEQLSEVYRILAITLGAPPKPNDKFVWEYYSKDKKYHRVETTPLKFYKEHCVVDLARLISLIDDPRNPTDVYTVDRLGSVVGARPVKYLNVGPEGLKKTAISLLQNDKPVWCVYIIVIEQLVCPRVCIVEAHILGVQVRLRCREIVVDCRRIDGARPVEPRRRFRRHAQHGQSEPSEEWRLGDDARHAHHCRPH